MRVCFVFQFLVLIVLSLLDKAFLSGITNRKLFLKEPQPSSQIDYLSMEPFGVGSSGKVYRVKEKVSEKLYAVKAVSQLYLKSRPSHANLLYWEICIHSSLPSHENVVNFERWYEDDLYYYIATEYCSGGDLFGKVAGTTNGLTESVAKGYAYRIALGIKHMHDHGIVHRDLKGENIFLNERDVPQIGDFGFATVVNDNTPPLTAAVGTATHVAPEIWERKPYSFPVDIWGFGVICFDMLFKYYPFNDEDRAELAALVRRGRFRFPLNKPVSQEAINFIRSLLIVNDKARPDIDAVLAHPWFDDVRRDVVRESSPPTDDLKPASTAVEAVAKNIENAAVEDGIAIGIRDRLKIVP